MFKGMICFADRRVITWLMAVFFFLGLIIPCNALSTTSAIPQVLSRKVTEPDTATRTRLMESYSRLPLSFEVNHGQTDGKVKFLSRGSGYNLFLAATEAVLSLRKPQLKDKAAQESALHKADKPEPATVVAMKLVGANPDPKIAGANRLSGKVNYFLGKDPKKWRTNIPTFARVRYTNVYPGIDLVFYGQGQKLEYDFIVAPGADPEAIALCFGQTSLKIEQNGDLALDAKGGELRLQNPLIYQDIDGIRKPVPGGYVLHPMKNEKQTHRVGFKVAAYDRTRALVIDPVLVYSTYLGGSYYDYGSGIAVDATGNCYVTGYTSSIDFPTQDPLYPDKAGSWDAFVTRLSPAGDAFVYSTYLGGRNNDYSSGIAVDATGSCYVTGYTSSTDFPTQDPLYPNAGSTEVFVTRLSPAGDALVYSTYLGGSSVDYGQGIAVDATGSCYVTGWTHSTDFPTQDPLYPDKAGGYDVFVTSLSPAGDALVYSTYLGGSSYDFGYGIAVDATGSCYVTGETWSTDFPTQDPLYPNYAGSEDAFVTSLSPAGDALVYSTYLGGSSGDYGYGIAVDATGSCYVTGWTHSTDFPTQDPLYPDKAGGGGNDVFVTRLSPAGDALIYSTYLGGSDYDWGWGIAVDATGSCYVTGCTSSTDFPTQDPLYPNNAGWTDAFVTSLSPAGDALVYSTYLGGSKNDDGFGIAVDATGSCYVTGRTYSTDFPTQDPLYPNNAGWPDAFVSKISMDSMAEWTFFVYLGADNSLSSFADADLEEMQQVGSDSNVNVVTLVDQHGHHDTHFYKVGYGSLTETSLSEIDPTWIDEVDMSDPSTLVTSANYVINQYPANRYCIVLWNHGDGWRKEPKKLVYRQIIEDKGNIMRMDDVGHALRDIKAHLGSKIDLVGFDACLMGMVEVAYEIRNHAEAMVGSEDLVAGEGWPYDTILEDLVNDAIMDSETFAGKIVDRYAEEYDGTSYWTLSALRLNMAHGLAILIDDFADSLTSNWNEIRLARSNSQEFAFWYLPYFHEHVDLYDFCSELNTAEAQAVMGKIDDMVINERHSSDLPDSYGLAIYFPANGEDYDSEYHASPDHQIMFPVDTSWDEFLARYYGEPIPDIKANGLDDPLFVTPSESVDISISLAPGDMAGVWADWWGILLSSHGNFPLFGFQSPLFELPDTSLFSSPWPMGWYIFLFGLDDVPDGAFELDWYDYVIVVSQPAGAQLKNIPNFDDIIKEKMRGYLQ